MVIPATLWDDREFMGDYKISFAQETRRVYIKGDLVGIIQRSKAINATYYNVPNHCEIIGDGTIQHFGIGLPDSPPCIHYVKCDRIVAQKLSNPINFLNNYFIYLSKVASSPAPQAL